MSWPIGKRAHNALPPGEAWRRKIARDIILYKRHPELAKANQARYRERHPDRVSSKARRQHLRKKYGLSSHDFDAMLIAQSGHRQYSQLAGFGFVLSKGTWMSYFALFFVVFGATLLARFVYDLLMIIYLSHVDDENG